MLREILTLGEGFITQVQLPYMGFQHGLMVVREILTLRGVSSLR